MAHKNFLIFSLVLLVHGLKLTNCEFAGSAKYKEPEVCRGSSEGLSASGASDEMRYRKLKQRYGNCTYVDGNLEIKFLEQPNITYDLSFLSNIEEVSGYVLITSVTAKYLPLTKLKIIRGTELFYYKNNNYSLFVALNHDVSGKVGLKELWFTNLSEITRGDIYFHYNDHLCFHDTILWKDIKFDPKYRVNHKTTNHCPPCAPECFEEKTNSRHCWGSGPDKCQKLIRELCHPSCDTGCFGEQINQCCHSQCAGGCNGPRSTDCVACKNFYNEGMCVNECPKPKQYNRFTMLLEDNPDGKYAYKSLCVKECPDYMLKDEINALCVRKCPAEFYPENNTCVQCQGICPKRCNGLKADEFLSSQNIDRFEDCTVIDGNLKIIHTTFAGDNYNGLVGLKREQLEVLKTVKEITGYLMVQGGNSQEMPDLFFLSNLQIIHGRELDIAGNAFSAILTKLKSLELISLQSIKNGKISLYRNEDLCFIEGTDFTQLFTVQRNLGQEFNIKEYVLTRENRDPKKCKQDNQVCHQSCSDEGCWGKGANKCLQCRSYKIDNSSNICIDHCKQVPMLYDAGNRLCAFCNAQCEDGCAGAGPGNCTKCKHVTMKHHDNTSTCLAQCPEMFYPDSKNICHPCHVNCAEGCTGPSNMVGNGGCNKCALAIQLNAFSFRCIADSESQRTGIIVASTVGGIVLAVGDSGNPTNLCNRAI